jgi:hypothetical protein
MVAQSTVIHSANPLCDFFQSGALAPTFSLTPLSLVPKVRTDALKLHITYSTLSHFRDAHYT